MEILLAFLPDQVSVTHHKNAKFILTLNNSNNSSSNNNIIINITMVFGEERKVGRQHVAGNCWEIKKKQKENTSGDNLGRTEHKERKWGWGWWETCAKRSKPEPSPQPEDYIGGSPIFFAISNAFPSIFSLYRRSMQSHTHIHTCIHACMHTYIHT